MAVRSRNPTAQQGPWLVSISAFVEQLPNPNNTVTLQPSKRDQWGNPLAVFNVGYGENERIMQVEAGKDAVAMLEAAGWHRDQLGAAEAHSSRAIAFMRWAVQEWVVILRPRC